jgi:hypothetical protein
MSLVLIPPVPHVHGVYRGSIVLSFVLIPDSTYSLVPGDQGGPNFSDLWFFLAVILCTNWCTTICIKCLILREIECNKFICNKFVLVLL